MFFPFDDSYYSTFCPSWRFFIRRFVPLKFFPFDVLSHSAFCLSMFCPSTFLTVSFFYFDILSVNPVINTCLHPYQHPSWSACIAASANLYAALDQAYVFISAGLDSGLYSVEKAGPVSLLFWGWGGGGWGSYPWTQSWSQNRRNHIRWEKFLSSWISWK